jgi:S-adenosylmethionine:tRNA ribosyltransferase-isomerase
VRIADFDFELPPDRIAQIPAPQRDHSRLLTLHRDTERVEHRRFPDLPDYLRPGDVLVLNDSRVIPARLRGENARTGGQFEILLLEQNEVNDWWAMLRPGRRARLETQIVLRDRQDNLSPVRATVLSQNAEGHRRLRFSGTQDISELLDVLGEVPLPPYIRRGASNPEERSSVPAPSSHEPAVTRPSAFAEATGDKPDTLSHRMGEGRGEGRVWRFKLPMHSRKRKEDLQEPEPCNDRERYQTVYARPPGSVAAPTAGLHFTRELLDEIRARGVRVCFVTLHVGLGTFAPVKAEAVAGHRMHEERYELSRETADAIQGAKAAGGRIFAVGTTTLRVLESVAAANNGLLVAGAGRTRLFIYPPCDFKIVDALVTNFHLPRSTLLMLVSAFAAPNETRGREMILSAYATAIRERYRFFSYGDAMLLL